MSESENFGHQHPLVLNERANNQSEGAVCSRCAEEVSVSVPSFRCVECEFHLHKTCAEAPLELNHPLHSKHPFLLLPNSPYAQGTCTCDFCDKPCEAFLYHCSCGLDFHVKCALFTYNIAQQNFEELPHVALRDPLITSQNDGDHELEPLKCVMCREPLLSSTYFSLDFGFHLHKKCADLPLKVNHKYHRKHPLVLEFIGQQFSCNICQESHKAGFVYRGLPCKAAVHIQCVSRPPPPTITDESHEHPFTLFWIRAPFVCHACGAEGDCVAYICSTCSIIVHAKCITVPRIIKSRWHHHSLFHTYFLHVEDFKSWICIICHEDVNVEYGGYYCSDCKILAHVNCAIKDETRYYIVSSENQDRESTDTGKSIDSITCVIERNDVGEATKIKHFKHEHHLILSEKIAEYDSCCDGCILPISASFYHCLECDFFLHKSCAELPKIKNVWFHMSLKSSLNLISGNTFICESCRYPSNGFGYECDECWSTVCIRCVTLKPETLICQGHKHPLLFYLEYEGKCSACGDDITKLAYCCNDCNFAICHRCVLLPNTVRHKCDKHVLVLTYHDDNKYSESHYCDICEERRDPNYWFYHCVTCDTSGHVSCILGRYPFMKLGTIYKVKNHQHHLTSVKKIFCYPDCFECGKPCKDLALECGTSGCNYIAHWRCVKPSYLH